MMYASRQHDYRFHCKKCAPTPAYNTHILLDMLSHPVFSNPLFSCDRCCLCGYGIDEHIEPSTRVACVETNAHTICALRGRWANLSDVDAVYQEVHGEHALEVTRVV